MSNYDLILPCAMRGRGSETFSDCGFKSKNVQQLEPRYDGVINSLTTVQKDNLILEIRFNKEVKT